MYWLFEQVNVSNSKYIEHSIEPEKEIQMKEQEASSKTEKKTTQLVSGENKYTQEVY